MEKFKIPVTWEMYGEVNIEAETIEEALEKAHKKYSIILGLCESTKVEENSVFIDDSSAIMLAAGESKS